jgi:hypothetical protein
MERNSPIAPWPASGSSETPPTSPLKLSAIPLDYYSGFPKFLIHEIPSSAISFKQDYRFHILLHADVPFHIPAYIPVHPQSFLDTTCQYRHFYRSVYLTGDISSPYSYGYWLKCQYKTRRSYSTWEDLPITRAGLPSAHIRYGRIHRDKFPGLRFSRRFPVTLE